ncbi:MAG: nicotinate-nucleotide diphosphorylase (carboxylating), partial [Thermoanaerobaculia bacterium]|nr:nicotinate-nucleotide diphosphorylase (carboxylating) [Thermoanaerobaculia bacterium]
MRPTQITDQLIQEFIKAGLHEDVRDGDHTSQATIPPDHRSRAVLKVKDYGVIAGVELAEHILRHVDPNCSITVHKPDGTDVLYGQIAFEVEGNTRALLQAERLVLNAMQ